MNQSISTLIISTSIQAL